MNRRELFGSIGAVAAAGAVPKVAWASQAGATATTRDGLKPQKIAAVELMELHGHYEAEAGVNGQSQVNPLDIYDEMRKPVYRDKPAGTKRVNTTAIYLRIKTADGLEGLYGPIEKEPAMVVWENLRPFLMGKDALATELMYRTRCTGRTGTRAMGSS